MLKELRLNNLAIIKNVDIELQNGLVSLTGETGAGKSIILDGISLLIGERSNLDMIRTGEKSLLAEGIFSLTEEQKNKLIKLDFDIEDEELIIQRYLDRDSKSKILVNGNRSTVTKLKELMSNILDLVGQHDHQSLLNKNYHLELLDKFLDKDGNKIKKEIKECVDKINKISDKIENIELEKLKIEEKKDIYIFQLDEILALDLKIDEDIELESDYKLLFNAGKISEKLLDSVSKLNDGEISVTKSLQKIKKNFEQLSLISNNYSEMLERLEKLVYELDDITGIIEDMSDDVESDDNKLDKIIKRLDSINKLKLKYGESIDEILKYKLDIENKLSLINFENKELEKLKSDRIETEKLYYELSFKLKQKREKISKMLEEKINNHLKDLKMENAVFKVNFIEKNTIRIKGTEDVEFMMATNVGEDVKSLAKIASGGEISRVMLALKVVFSEVDDISVLIFDEIDTGISGETVKKVADKLKVLSSNVQVICVTHSQQIAAKSAQQYLIKKEVENNLTETKVLELSESERIREIARMISGDTITETSINHAKEIMGIE